MPIYVDTMMIETPGAAVHQIEEGEDLIIGSDDTLDHVRRDPDRMYVDVHHGSLPFGGLSSPEEEDSETSEEEAE
jgi:hypothetical protein